MTVEQKMKEVERLVLEILDESPGQQVRIQIGYGHVTLNDGRDHMAGMWYASNGTCYPLHREELGNKCRCSACEDYSSYDS